MSSYEDIRDLIAKLALQNSYWGYLFTRVHRKASDQVDVMGVKPEPDGSLSLLYNPNILNSTSQATLELVLEHEGLHIINKHISRYMRIMALEFDENVKAFKTEVWYKAADLAVNSQMNMPEKLEIQGREFITLQPKQFKLKPKESTEYYYYELLKKLKPIQPSKGKGGGEGEGSDNKSDNGSSDNEQPGNHDMWKEVTNATPDKSAAARKIENYSTTVIKDSYKNFNRNRDKNRGHLSSNIIELIEQMLLPPQFPYYELIRHLVRASKLSKFKRSHTRINRKRTYLFNIDDDQINMPALSPFPGRTRDYTFNISTILDTSGSMSREEIMEGLSGVKNIIENDKYCKTTVIENDTEIRKEYIVKRLSDIDYSVRGRGGTILFPALERCKQLKTDVTLIFTDGYCEDINQINRRLLPKKMIWVISKDGSANLVNKTGFVVKLNK